MLLTLYLLYCTIKVRYNEIFFAQGLLLAQLYPDVSLCGNVVAHVRVLVQAPLAGAFFVPAKPWRFV